MTGKTIKEVFGEELNSADKGRKFKKLSLTELDSVSGGEMDEKQEKLLRLVLSKPKNLDNCTLGEVVELIPQYYEEYFSKFPNVRISDILFWILEHWDEI